MKYTMVKQFSNGAADNFFNVFYRIIDFGKILLEVFWAFFDILSTIYLIFFNIFMYIYYFSLFSIEQIATFQRNIFLRGKGSQKKSNIPNIIKARPRRAKRRPSFATNITQTVSKTATIATNTVKTIPAPKVHRKAGKKSISKSILEFFEGVGLFFYKMVTTPFKAIANFFINNIAPTKEKSEKSSEKESKGSSLISEYLKEYEKGK